MEKIMKFLEELMEPITEFIRAHYGNPILWIALFMGGLLIFKFVYSALSNE